MPAPAPRFLRGSGGECAGSVCSFNLRDYACPRRDFRRGKRGQLRGSEQVPGVFSGTCSVTKRGSVPTACWAYYIFLNSICLVEIIIMITITNELNNTTMVPTPIVGGSIFPFLRIQSNISNIFSIVINIGIITGVINKKALVL